MLTHRTKEKQHTSSLLYDLAVQYLSPSNQGIVQGDDKRFDHPAKKAGAAAASTTASTAGRQGN